ncbi:MAG TPA: heme lyase CcmF/NrfE family subunit [Candidatus Acidoferrales bacterium]|jgi:cytochrome c-type biogenesis protein CcmF|nr:heme lyase CcmF/NrfE family subunit [Candidatus Acidoferrales bacterium]
MENLGALAILLAFCVAAYATLACVIGRLKAKPFLLVSGERAVYAVWVLVTLASGILVYSLMTGDFRFAYVAEHSNRSMPTLYKYAAWWGGQEGSLLFWSFLLATYASVVVFTNRRKHRDMMPWVVAVLTTIQTFFLVLNNFVANPFQMLATDKLIVAVPDGNGLSPLLQYPAMAIHPPMLYLGYVGFAVPFAFAIGSLITKQPGDGWIHTTRRWTLVTWLFQSTGVMLGAAWAYHVLGWGGYWGWDPVENASLLPWISGTAFLHSVMMQEKKGMMKVWNIVLVSTTFFLCILGTFLTRSGVVQSVHAFARSEIGKYFVTFLALGIAATIYLILDRLEYLKSESELESVISRESSFLFNNLILLASCFAVLWGTLFPVISEAATGNKISLDGDWYNRLMVPIGLFLLLLTGVGPLFAWRRTSVESLRRNFQLPGIASLVLVGALIAAGMRHPYALISFGFCLFVALTVISEFYKGAKAIAAKTDFNLLHATVELTHRNTRRYGGYLVHMGIVLMFIGFTGHAFNQAEVKELNKGDTMKVGVYTLRMTDLLQGENENYAWHRANMEVTKNGQVLGTLEPEKRFYKASRQGTSEVGIRQRPNEDLYLNFGGMSDDNLRAVIQAYVFPLVSWIWIGGLVLIGGTFVCLVPSKVKMQYARTEVVGYATQHATVKK